MKKYYLQYVLVSFFYSLYGNVLSQNDFSYINRDKQTLRFALAPLAIQGLQLNHFGENLLNTKPVLGGDLGVAYIYRISNNLCFIAGANFTLIPYHVSYEFNADLQNTTLSISEHEHTSTEYVFTAFSTPLSMRYNHKPKKGLIYTAELGMRFNFTPITEHTFGTSYSVEDNNPVGIELFYMDLVNANQLLSYFGKIGLMTYTKRSNAMGFNLIAHYVPESFWKGQYAFYNLPFASYGAVGVGGNFIGLEFFYELQLGGH